MKQDLRNYCLLRCLKKVDAHKFVESMREFHESGFYPYAELNDVIYVINYFA